jgi:hypothetical protein
MDTQITESRHGRDVTAILKRKTEERFIVAVQEHLLTKVSRLPEQKSPIIRGGHKLRILPRKRAPLSGAKIDRPDRCLMPLKCTSHCAFLHVPDLQRSVCRAGNQTVSSAGECAGKNSTSVTSESGKSVAE